MADKPKSGTPSQVSDQTLFLGLLTAICLDGAHTFTIYTSRKGRIWLSVKTWGDLPYSSSVELDPAFHSHWLVKCGILALYTHARKIWGRVTAEDTWYSGNVDQSVLSDAIHAATALLTNLEAGMSLEQALAFTGTSDATTTETK